MATKPTRRRSKRTPAYTPGVQLAKYSPPATNKDVCDCDRSGDPRVYGEVTHQYPYYDANGKRLFSRFRYLIHKPATFTGKADKTFRYCDHFDKSSMEHQALVYGLPRVTELVRNSTAQSRLFLVEGEGDCEACWALARSYATTTHLGTKFPVEVAEHMRGFQGVVYIVVDRDHLDEKHQKRFKEEGFDFPGDRSALRKWRALREVGVKCFFREAAVGKDLRDHLEAGKTVDQLKKVSLETIKARAPKEARSNKSTSMVLSDSDMPEGPAMRRFIQALEAQKHYVDPIGGSRYKTNCPNPHHEDRNPSFEFEQGEGCVRMWCESTQGPCTDETERGMAALLAFLGLKAQDLYDKKRVTRRVKLVADKSKQVDAQDWPAFHEAFKGHIGTTTDNEPNDKGNGKRMLELYGKVFRKVNTGPAPGWRVWTGTHWGYDTGSIAMAATADLTDYMEAVEVHDYEDPDMPAFPSDWDVLNQGGKPYKTLFGRYGAITQAPAQVALYAAKGQAQAEFLGERLAWEQSDNIFQRTLQWIEKCKDGARMREAVKQLEHQPGISVTDEEFDNVRGTFCVQNGEINTHTLELGPHKLEDMNTRIAPVRYNSKAKAPIWEAYLATNQPNEETRRYLQKLTGYAMSGDGDQKLIAFLYSKEGDTGKSIFLKVIERILGSTYSATLAEGALSKRRFDTGGRDPDRDAIRGKRFVVSSELAPNEPLDERFVKQLTGGDGVSTRGNYSKEGNTRWQPECLVLVATNHLSRINAEDEAIWNRIQVVPWSVSFPKGHPDRDEKLADKILGDDGFPGETEGVLNWIIEGLRLYRAEGLEAPDEVVNASMTYRSDADVVQMWLASAVEDGDVVVGDEAYTPQRRDLFTHMQAWAKAERSRDTPGLRAFYARLEELGFKMGTKKLGNDDSSKRKVLLGIALTGDAAVGKFTLNGA